MLTREQIIAQMAEAGLPALPDGHPVYDGKAHRFGPKKKAWYLFRQVKLDSGREVRNGSFGVWQGQDSNSVKLRMDWSGVSDEERAEVQRKQEAYEKAEAERKQRKAEMAASRARQAWTAAADSDQPSPYLARKRVQSEKTRVDSDGVLLVPVMKYSEVGATLAGLQRIQADGEKRFSSGIDMVGGACLLGRLAPEAKLIEIGEGYATCETVRMATDFDTPTMVAFNAGNLLPVAKQLRALFPGAHLLFLADDDMRVIARLAECLREDFGVEWTPVIDSADHQLTSAKDEAVSVRATWRNDAAGTPYIEADVRAGRMVRLLKFENAGVSRSRAAARVVGNASVVVPTFAARAADSKDSDFNDLYLAESLDVVRDQVRAARSLALTMEQAPTTSPTDDEPPAYLDDVPMPDAPAVETPIDVATSIRVPTLEVLLAHMQLIYPTTDIWDGLRKQRLKKSAFAAWVGKDLASAWEKDVTRRTILRESLPTLVGGKAVEGAGAGGGKLGEMLDNLTLLRGTETVWDGIGQQVMSLGAVRADYTAELTGKWQEHAQRKTIEARNLVFDPTQQADPVSHVNIFLGWPLTPKQDDALVGPILALLASLCDAEDRADEAMEWILRWLAYPLQHPGAKMQTALLMFGEKQGTGKSLFFQDVMQPIYGDYGTVASQHQLESSFTAWRSRKLFVLFEEVLSRDDKYSHNGTLKYMITGKTTSINEKNLPLRDERNHMNATFLSNEPQPIPIELEDRRFMVIEARRKQDPAFYADVQRSIAAGGIQAFYHFLLNLPLDGFNEHTKPPMTLAKERVIEFGLAGWMSFHRAWKDGYLDAPYTSCLSEDLYIIYKRWCDKSGEKPLTLCKFAGLIGSRETKSKKSVAVDSKHKKTRMVFVVDNPDFPGPLDEQIAKFRKLGDVRADRALQG
jgi:putative DNA primase/helicase